MNKRFLGVLLSVIAFSGMLGADTQTPPQMGQTTPDFSLPSAEGGLVSVKDYKGKWMGRSGQSVNLGMPICTYRL